MHLYGEKIINAVRVHLASEDLPRLLPAKTCQVVDLSKLTPSKACRNFSRLRLPRLIRLLIYRDLQRVSLPRLTGIIVPLACRDLSR
jgi:hypothetical protein